MEDTDDNIPNGRDTMPRQGSVRQVCQQWSVHEDGVMAYHLQNNEIERHYGLNRFNRRTVREDIPVARVVQSEEEMRQQEERYEELMALRAQAEEDEDYARRVAAEMSSEEIAKERQRELNDEEIARKFQEKENKKHEHYLEKKRIKDLKKERELLERQVEMSMQQAGLAAGIDGLEGSMRNVNMADTQSGDRSSVSSGRGHNAVRVTPAGRIEDDGDFSDFFAIPDNVNPEERKVIQEIQDEELAKLLQEQEHKRTKAEVDRRKLREIEEQDEKLAKIIQEQDKLRLKRAKEKKKQQQEEMRRQQMTNPATRPLPDLPGHNRSVDSDQGAQGTTSQRSQDRPRLRRHSFLQGIDNGPSDTSPTTAPPDLPQNSIKEVERWLARTEPPSYKHAIASTSRGRLRSDNSDHADPHPPPSLSPPGSYHSEDEVPYRPPVRQSKGHNQYRDDEPCYAVSNAIPFNNIAAAIDPTFQRRHHDLPHRSEETEMKVPLSASMPVQERNMRDDHDDDVSPSATPWQPVQGQRRSAGDKSKKSRKYSPNTQPPTKDQKNNCKQQ